MNMLYGGKEEIHREIVNYLLTQVVQSNKYYKSRSSLTSDRDFAEHPCLRYRKSRSTSHYTTE